MFHSKNVFAEEDLTEPEVSLAYQVYNQKATIQVTASDSDSGVANITYLKGNVLDITHDKWKSKGKVLSDIDSFIVSSSGNYSVLVEDNAGNKKIEVIYVELEFKAVWISYLEFLSYGAGGYTEENFIAYINTTFDHVVALGMNAVVVQVRPYGDAMYDSRYFPWSKYASGVQGLNPGFDPLEYMIEAAHDRGLEFHAWLNPYRITTGSTDISLLAEDNPARKWLEDSHLDNDRNVLSFGGNLYYNPASKEVRSLITKGVKEIIVNYDVDGIHFDDYFYPSLGSKYTKVFDHIEYIEYVSESKEANKEPLSIVNWRKSNVNTLIRSIYKTIKSIDSSIQFGISPSGNPDLLSKEYGYYVDYETWLSSNKYIDYICPQIYWTFNHSTCPYDMTLDRWIAARTSSTVKIYVGIAAYRSGSKLESDWETDPYVLADQIIYGRNSRMVDGYIFYRYDFFNNSTTKEGIEHMLELF